MSVEAITWALKQPVKPSSVKFVLVVLANCASGDTFLAYPSTAYLCEATGQDRKTVMGNLAKLRDCGLVEDTGKRAGVTKQVVVYRVLCGPGLFTKEAQKRDSTENGTVPVLPNNSTVFPDKQAQKRDTETSGTVRNQTAGAATRGTRLPKDWMPSEEGKAYATEQCVDWKTERENFRDYWIAQPGQRGVRLDWDAVWRTWMRRSNKTLTVAAAPSVPRKPAGPSETPFEAAMAYARRLRDLGQLDSDAFEIEARRIAAKHRGEEAHA
jgi:Pyocin large subunit